MAATIMSTQPGDLKSPNLAFNCIVSHIFANPGTYDPTGGAGSWNASERGVIPSHFPQPLRKDAAKKRFSEQLKPKEEQSQYEDRRDMSAFTAALLNQISRSTDQPFSLPTTFMISFLQHCFHPDLTLVDFPQSLVGLEYLEELDKRRKRAISAGLSRLGISKANLRSDADNLAKTHPSFAAWVKDVEPAERKAEALYTQLYVALRRWILLNEFCLAPFHRYNCIAMLNVLLPPPSSAMAKVPPSPYLTAAVLHEQREMYIRHIDAVEAKGIRVLRNLMDQGKRDYEITGWPSVRETLDKYLRIAEKLINEAESIDDFGAFDEPTPTTHTSASPTLSKRKTGDSGVSFGSSNTGKKHTPSTSTSVNYIPGDMNKPLPTTPSRASSPSDNDMPPTTIIKAASTLEKIAIELRKLKIRHKVHVSTDSTEGRGKEQRKDTLDKITAPSPQDTTDVQTTNYSRLLGSSPTEQQQPASNAVSQVQAEEPADRMEEDSRRHSRSLSRSKSRSRSRSLSVGRLRLGKVEDDTEAFNRDEMMRQRMIWEARNSA